MIKLVNDTIDNGDIDELIGWLSTYPRLTKGELTLEYEEEWAKYLGTKYAVFVNSGSSANLLMLYSMIESGIINKGDKVVVPALSWSTDLAPVVQLGLEPVLCDCNMEDLSVDLKHLEELIEKESPKVLMLVSVLGLVPNMKEIKTLCNENGVVLLEDSCESLGSEHQKSKIGSFGLMSSFSTYFGHHISTIEGGMVCTNDREMFNVLKALRSHGWDRDLEEYKIKQLRDEYDVSDFNALYTFYYYGFNFRATDLQAFLGMGQLKKLEDIVTKRNENYELYNKLIKNTYWKPAERAGSYVSNFAYPIIHPNRQKIIENLNRINVENRPLICGSLSEQPMWIKKYGRRNLKNAKLVHEYGMYIPNNHHITKEEIELVCDAINRSAE